MDNLTQSATPSPPDITPVRQTIEEHFPGLWPAVDVTLSTSATLILEDNANPGTVILNAGPSKIKTTVAGMLADHPLCYVSDNFTPASFVSHAANVARNQLAQVDLLPRIRHKVLVTPELAPIFRGKEDELAQRFSIITRVLDGHGLMTDSGTHGRRGYRGDYLFAWIGCTTPFDAKVWRVMAQLGSRLFFFDMDSAEEVSAEDLVNSNEETPYLTKLERCRAVVHPFLSDLFEHYGGIRGTQWNQKADPREVRHWIAWLARLLAKMRSEPVWESDPYRGDPQYAPAKTEMPWRAYAVLYNLARGHALVHGRTQLCWEDLPLVVQVTVSTMPTECRLVFKALVENRGQPLTVAQTQAALKIKHLATARKVMEGLDRLGVAEYIQSGPGIPAVLRFRPDWAWCAEPDFRQFLAGDA